jgi:hypothetical protein
MAKVKLGSHSYELQAPKNFEKSTKFVRLCGKMEKNVGALWELFDWMFGEEQTEQIVEDFPDIDELQAAFLALIFTRQGMSDSEISRKLTELNLPIVKCGN